MPGYQRYVSVHPFKYNRVLFFRSSSVREVYTARQRQRNGSADTDYGNEYG